MDEEGFGAAAGYRPELDQRVEVTASIGLENDRAQWIGRIRSSENRRYDANVRRQIARTGVQVGQHGPALLYGIRDLRDDGRGQIEIPAQAQGDAPSRLDQ